MSSLFKKKKKDAGDASPEEVGEQPTDPAFFLGTLRSELDTPAEISSEFRNLEIAFAKVLTVYQRGLINKEETGEILTNLRISDSQGTQWTLGATTRRWYKRTLGSSWKVTPPPAAANDPVLEETAFEALHAAAQLVESLTPKEITSG